MITATPQHWSALASHLHLTPYAPTASYTFGASFRQVKHALGVRATGAPSLDHWLHGDHRGVEVVFLTFVMNSVGPSPYTGSAPGQVAIPVTTPIVYCAAVARIDPPLFLGLGISPRAAFLHRDLFGPKTLTVGDKAFDHDLALVSTHPEQALAFLSPRDAEGAALLARMTRTRASADGLLVSDSLVLCPRRGIIVDPAVGEKLLDDAVDLARACGARRLALPLPESDRLVQQAWARFATTHGFAFDDARLVLDGQIDGSTVEIALENEGQAMRTAVTVRFPSPITIAFSAKRTSEGFLHGLLHRDIQVGHAKFDALFTVTGHPEAAVKTIFARPELVDVLTRIGSLCTDVQMSPREIHFRLPGACSSVEQLHEIATMAHVATHALFGGATAYRG